jgi:hypothetical protein
MRALRVAVPLVIAFSLVGCGPDDKDVTMPDVTGKKLDVAYDQIKDAGFDDKDKIKIEGGGTFGVVVESNWTVCEQSPTAGKPMSDAPTLTVDRSCDSDEDKETEEPSETASESSSESPSEDSTPSESPSEAAPPTESATTELPEILTAENNSELAALLKLGDDCSNTVAAFAKKYAGHTIQFDGSIVAIAPHGSYETRFDILVEPGDFDPDRAIGPSFQFRDKNVFDLNLTGKKIPDSVEVGQNYTFVAELGDYNPNTCLYQLEPVETRVR